MIHSYWNDDIMDVDQNGLRHIHHRTLIAICGNHLPVSTCPPLVQVSGDPWTASSEL